MERVTGIGGVFFRADDPDQLGRWYAEHLGVDPAPESYDVPSWWQQAGPTVFTPMAADSEHFGSPPRAWSINFRVRDLDAMISQLRTTGIEVTLDHEAYPNGRFASLEDPEATRSSSGNPTEPISADRPDEHWNRSGAVCPAVMDALTAGSSSLASTSKARPIRRF